MANIIVSREQLKQQSIRVYDGMSIIYENGKEETLEELLELIPKFPNCFAVNNSTVGYIMDNEFWVTPYVRSVVLTLKMMQFKQSEFSVPFSNGCYPKEEKEKWILLRKHSRIKLCEDMQNEFRKFCRDFGDAAGIKELSENTLKKCFHISTNGFKIRQKYYEDYIYPMVDEWSDYSKIEFCLGHYATNNGKVIFVDINGDSYIAKGYGILNILKEAGYTKKALHVPLSNGEEIQDELLRRKWNELPKF